MLKDIDFCHFLEIYLTNMAKKLLGTGINASKSDSKKIIDKVSEATGEVLGITFANKFVEPVEEIIIPPEKAEEILNELRLVLN